MADNIAITQGSGTTIATEDVSSVQHQKVKVEFGGDGVATMVSSSDPMPVVQTGTPALPTGASTLAEQQTQTTHLSTIAGDTTSIDAKIPALGQALAAASTPVVLTAAQITTLTPPAAITGFSTSAKQDTIIGHVDGIEGLLTTIDGDTGTIATEVAGLLTDTELRATPVPVSGTVTANLSATDNAVLDDIALDTEAIKTSLAGTLTVTGGGGGTEYTEGDTDASITGSAIMWEDTADTLRAVSAAKPLPISDAGGTLTVDGTVAVTNAGITTIAGAVSGTEMQVDVLTMPTTAVTGTFWQATQPVSLTSTTVTGTVAVTQSGTWDEVGINDSGNTITVDAPVGSPVYVRLSNGADEGSLPIDGDTSAHLFRGLTIFGKTSGNVAKQLQTDTDGQLQIDIVGALPAGTNAIGKLAANSGVDIGDVDVTSISAGSNLIGDVGIQGRTTGGLTIFRSIDLDETEEEVKATAGTIYGIYAINLTAAPLYLKIYDLTAANTTVGTSTPVLTFPIVANADSDGAGFVLNIVQGIAFSTAISAAVTTGIADADVGAPGANQAIVQIFYK